MIILIKSKRKTEGMSIITGIFNPTDFFLRTGKKAYCRANYTFQGGSVTITAEPPAFCGFENKQFYIASKEILISIKPRFITKIFYKDHDDGKTTDCELVLRDGTSVYLTLL
jgi:hypothetical protein